MFFPPPHYPNNSSKRKARASPGQFLKELLLFFLDGKNLFAAVIAAFRANAVRTDHRAAMRASDQAGDFELEVRAAQSFPGFAGSSLWDCHSCFSFEFRWELYRDGD